jgi:hypothetical protein
VPDNSGLTPLRGLEFLCRGLCRNAGVPARVARGHSVSVALIYVIENPRRTRMDIAFFYGLSFFGVAPSRTGLRFDTVEVWVRVPTSLPLLLIDLPRFAVVVFKSGPKTVFS